MAIFFFAFTFIIGKYAYAENALTYLTLATPAGITTLRLLALGMVLWGAVQTVAVVFDAADAAMGMMASINLVAIVLLSGLVVKLLRQYLTQQREGKRPHFHAADLPEVTGQLDPGMWQTPRRG